MEERLASDLLREIKKESHRRFILLVICIVLLFVSNMAWLVAWNIPTERVIETYDMQGQDKANLVVNGEGEVRINEPYSDNESESSSGKQTEK